MRHSSWTLFLVPLALPLVLLFLPGSMNSTDQSNPSAGAPYEQVQEMIPVAPIESASGEISEALFKD